MCTMPSNNESSYTSYTSASEDIGSEDSSEVIEGVELSSSSTATTTSSPASSPRRSPRLAEKRSRILEKEGVKFRPKRSRYDTGRPPYMTIVPASSLPHPRAAGPPVPGGLFSHPPPHVPTVRLAVWPTPPPSPSSPSEASTSPMGKRTSSEVESSSDSEAKRPRQIPPRGIPPPQRALPPQRAPPRQYPPPPLPSPTRRRFGPWRRIRPFALFKNEPLCGPHWQPRFFDSVPESFATSGVKIPRATARANVSWRKAPVRGTSPPPPPPPPPSPPLPEYSPDSSRSGESCSGRYSSSLPSSGGSSPASPAPSPSAGRTTRSGRFYPYLKPASSASARRSPPAAATTPLPATPPPTTPPPATPPPATPPPTTPPQAATPPTTGPITRSQTGSLPRSSVKRPLTEPTTTAAKRLQKAWELSEEESKGLREWQKAAHQRFEALKSVASIDPGLISSRKRRSIEEANRANLHLEKLMDTSDLLVAPTAFARLGRGVLAEVAPEKKYHFAGAALNVLQRAVEDIVISSFTVMYDFTKHRKAIELNKQDFKIFRSIYKGSYPYFEF